MKKVYYKIGFFVLLAVTIYSAGNTQFHNALNNARKETRRQIKVKHSYRVRDIAMAQAENSKRKKQRIESMTPAKRRFTKFKNFINETL